MKGDEETDPAIEISCPEELKSSFESLLDWEGLDVLELFVLLDDVFGHGYVILGYVKDDVLDFRDFLPTLEWKFGDLDRFK